MPIDPHRFPTQDGPKVAIRRRTARPAAAAPAVVSKVATADRSATSASTVLFPAAKVLDATRSFEPIVRFEKRSPVVESPPPTTTESNDAAESIEAAPEAPPEPIDSRTTLLGPSEMMIPESPTLRYDAAELGPMLEEMAVRKVLLEQTLGRMRQALQDEEAELAAEAEEISAERTGSTRVAPSASPDRSSNPAGGAKLGLFFWFGSAIASALIAWGALWLMRAALFDPTLFRTGAALAIFGAVALASNAMLHLDAILPSKSAVDHIPDAT